MVPGALSPAGELGKIAALSMAMAMHGFCARSTEEPLKSHRSRSPKVDR